MRQPYKKPERDEESYYPNEETIAAIEEAELISAGKIPAKSFSSVDELLEDLMTD